MCEREPEVFVHLTSGSFHFNIMILNSSHSAANIRISFLLYYWIIFYFVYSHLYPHSSLHEQLSPYHGYCCDEYMSAATFWRVINWWNGKVSERGRDRKRRIFHSLIDSSNDHKSQGWVSPNPGTRNSTWVSHIGDRGPRIVPSSIAFSGVSPGSWMGQRLELAFK